MSKQIKNAVSAIFNLGLNDQIKAMSKKPYVFGVSAPEDYSLLNSVLSQVRWSIINLQKVDMTALQDRPSETSRDGNKEAMPDSEMEIERVQQLKRAVLTASILEAALDSIGEKARKETEKAGVKTKDGSRFRFNLNRSNNKEFKPFMKEWKDYLVDQKVRNEPGSTMFAKILEAEDQVFETVGNTQAVEAVHKMFDSDDFVDNSDTAWDNMLYGNVWHDKAVSFAEYGEAMADYERLARTSTDAQELNKARRELKRIAGNCKWWFELYTSNTGLLCVNGVPASLIESSYWRTEETKAQVVEAEQLLEETLSKQVLIKTQVKLMKTLDALEEADADAEFNEALAYKLAKMKARENKVEQPLTESKQPTQPTSLMPNIIDSASNRAAH